MTNCSRECDPVAPCPFVCDLHCSTRYVCLQCGLDREIRPSSWQQFPG